MRLESRFTEWGRTCQFENKTALMLTLEIYVEQVWVPKIVKLLKWMCRDGSHNLVFLIQRFGLSWPKLWSIYHGLSRPRQSVTLIKKLRKQSNLG